MPANQPYVNNLCVSTEDGERLESLIYRGGLAEVSERDDVTIPSEDWYVIINAREHKDLLGKVIRNV